MKADLDMRRMEEGAREAYAQDIARNADMTSQSLNRALEAATAAGACAIGPLPPVPLPSDATASTAGGARRRQVDPLALPLETQEIAEMEARKLALLTAAQREEGENPTLWCEAVSDEGHTYYWNVKTNGSVLRDGIGRLGRSMTEFF